jgi:hypothetical protein
LGDKTPATVNSTFLMRIVWPTESAPHERGPGTVLPVPLHPPPTASLTMRPVAKTDDSIRVRGDLIRVRNQDDGDALGAVQSLKNAKDFGAVEINSASN